MCGVSEFQREDLGEASIVQLVAYSDVAGAGATDARAGDSCSRQCALIAQRIEMEAHRGHMQLQPRGELGRVRRSVVLADQCEYPLALPSLPLSIAAHDACLS